MTMRSFGKSINYGRFHICFFYSCTCIKLNWGIQYNVGKLFIPLHNIIFHTFFLTKTNIFVAKLLTLPLIPYKNTLPFCCNNTIKPKRYIVFVGYLKENDYRYSTPNCELEITSKWSVWLWTLWHRMLQ